MAQSTNNIRCKKGSWLIHTQTAGSTSAWVRVSPRRHFQSPQINSRFPDILLVLPKNQLFQPFKTMSEYPVKS
jgi:hypothetical protein